jgi:hypothetical protein
MAEQPRSSRTYHVVVLVMTLLQTFTLIVVFATVLLTFAYNELPGFTVEPNEADREVCDQEAVYGWRVFDHAWICEGEWLFPGVPGGV